jgi:hypothetical protein
MVRAWADRHSERDGTCSLGLSRHGRDPVMIGWGMIAERGARATLGTPHRLRFAIGEGRNP